MQQFEYKVLDVAANSSWFSRGGKINHQELVEKLNELGREGWEVVSCSDLNMHHGASRSVVIIMKRPINN